MTIRVEGRGRVSALPRPRAKTANGSTSLPPTNTSASIGSGSRRTGKLPGHRADVWGNRWGNKTHRDPPRSERGAGARLPIRERNLQIRLRPTETTGRTQNPVSFGTCGFDPHLRHRGGTRGSPTRPSFCLQRTRIVASGLPAGRAGLRPARCVSSGGSRKRNVRQRDRSLGSSTLYPPWFEIRELREKEEPSCRRP